MCPLSWLQHPCRTHICDECKECQEAQRSVHRANGRVGTANRALLLALKGSKQAQVKYTTVQMAMLWNERLKTKRTNRF